MLAGHTESVSGANISADGSTLVSWSPDRTARCWSCKGGACLAVLLHNSPVERALLAPYGSLVATTTEEGHIHLWDATSGQRLRELQVRQGYS